MNQLFGLIFFFACLARKLFSCIARSNIRCAGDFRSWYQERIFLTTRIPRVGSDEMSCTMIPTDETFSYGSSVAKEKTLSRTNLPDCGWCFKEEPPNRHFDISSQLYLSKWFGDWKRWVYKFLVKRILKKNVQGFPLLLEQKKKYTALSPPRLRASPSW